MSGHGALGGSALVQQAWVGALEQVRPLCAVVTRDAVVRVMFFMVGLQ